MKNVKGLPYIVPPKLPPWPLVALFQPLRIIPSSLDRKKPNDFNPFFHFRSCFLSFAGAFHWFCLGSDSVFSVY